MKIVDVKKLAKIYEISSQDMENIIRSMLLEDIQINEENIEEYIKNYDAHNVNIRITKNTQRILKSLKEGRETYEDTILRISTNEI